MHIYTVIGTVHDSKIEKKGRGLMAKSKLMTANEKMAEKVVTAYKKVEDTVVGSYKKIEDAFVDRYLAKDGESIEEAKARLKNEQDTANIAAHRQFKKKEFEKH